MKYYNANIYHHETGFVHGSFETTDGKFDQISLNSDIAFHGTDLKNNLVIPGLIDIHTHGNSGYDFSDGNSDNLYAIGKYLLSHGITGFMPTSMTLPYSKLEKACISAYELCRSNFADCSDIIGIHMEGPYLSPKHKGSQNPEYLRKPDIEECLKLQELCHGLIKIVDIAPEIEGAGDFIKSAAKLPNPQSGRNNLSNVVISIAHTDADYDTAVSAFNAGASHVTHLFNAMPSLHHRAPGVIGAAAEQENITVELICDGIHIHPSVIRAAFKLFPHRICLISDSIRTCGMTDGEYELGGQKVYLRNGTARLQDGTLAGSSANLFECMKRAISFGIPVKAAIEAATLIPAKCLGLQNTIGTIQEGNNADFLICDDKFNLLEVFKNGNSVWKR